MYECIASSNKQQPLFKFKSIEFTRKQKEKKQKAINNLTLITERKILKKKKANSCTWPPDNSTTANLPSEIAFNPIFHHLSLSSIVLSSTVDTVFSGTGSIAAAGSPVN